jgi:hypothetical protein
MLNENSRRSPWAFLALLLSGGAQAQTPFSAEQIGMGGAGVARTDSSGFRNGAAMVLAPGFYTYSEIGWGQGFSLGQAMREVRPDTAVGASFGYTWGKSNLPPTLDEMPGWIEPGELLTNARTSREFRGAGGVRLLGGRLGLGIGGRYVQDDSELGGEQSQAQVDVSAAGILAEGVSLALGAKNLIADESDPFCLELGLWWSAVEAFNFGLDAVFQEGVVEGRIGASRSVAWRQLFFRADPGLWGRIGAAWGGHSLGLCPLKTLGRKRGWGDNAQPYGVYCGAYPPITAVSIHQ